MSTLKTRFGQLSWISKVALGSAILILISGIAWMWVPQTSPDKPAGPLPDPTITAAHQKIIDSLIAPIERSANTTPVPARVRAIRTNTGVTTFLTVPITRKENITDEQFIRDAKEESANIINNLFASDTTIQILSVSTTYPLSDGRESIVLSIFMPRKTWQDNGKITGNNIEKLAQSFQINKEFAP